MAKRKEKATPAETARWGDALLYLTNGRGRPFRGKRPFSREQSLAGLAIQMRLDELSQTMATLAMVLERLDPQSLPDPSATLKPLLDSALATAARVEDARSVVADCMNQLLTPGGPGWSIAIFKSLADVNRLCKSISALLGPGFGVVGWPQEIAEARRLAAVLDDQWKQVDAAARHVNHDAAEQDAPNRAYVRAYASYEWVMREGPEAVRTLKPGQEFSEKMHQYVRDFCPEYTADNPCPSEFDTWTRYVRGGRPRPEDAPSRGADS